MVDVNIVIPIALLVLAFMSLPLLIQFAVRRKVKGRHLCAIIEKGKPLAIKLLKVHKDDFVKDGEDEWILKPSLMKPVDYPIGWPSILSSFQQTVWCSLIMRGSSDPLDWENPPASALSSKEVPAILDPHWLITLVKGVGELGGQAGRTERILAMVAAGASVIALVMMFYLITRLGAVEQAIEALRAVTRGVVTP